MHGKKKINKLNNVKDGNADNFSFICETNKVDGDEEVGAYSHVAVHAEVRS